MEMNVSWIRSNGRVARNVRKRLAPVAVAALMLGVVDVGLGIPQAHAGIRLPGEPVAIAAVAGEESPPGPGAVATEYSIVLEEAVGQDLPPGPSATGDDTPPGPGVASNDLPPGPNVAGDDFPPGPTVASQDFPPGPSATGDDFPPGPGVADDDYPPGPGIIAVF
jgi:hypothetical protein